MFECIAPDTYEFELIDDCYVGKLTKGLDFTSNTRVGASVIQAPSVGSYLSYLRNHCPAPKQGRESCGRKSGYKESFYALESYEEAMDIFVNRPHEIRTFKPEDETLAVPDESGREVFFDVTGDYIDIERAIEGVPEAMGNLSMGNPRSMYATIIINTMAPWYVDQEVLAERGRRLLRLVDWLEHQRIRVQVKLFSGSQCFYNEIEIKRFDQYMDLDNLAIASHVDFFRRMQFRFMEYSPTWQSGYGTATTIELGTMKFPNRLREQRGIYLFSENHRTVDSVTKSFDLTTKTIKNKLADGETNIVMNF